MFRPNLFIICTTMLCHLVRCLVCFAAKLTQQWKCQEFWKNKTNRINTFAHRFAINTKTFASFDVSTDTSQSCQIAIHRVSALNAKALWSSIWKVREWRKMKKISIANIVNWKNLILKNEKSEEFFGSSIFWFDSKIAFFYYYFLFFIYFWASEKQEILMWFRNRKISLQSLFHLKDKCQSRVK